jgi:hypothetical protein
MALTPESEGWAKALASQVPMTHPAWNVTRSEATETDVTGDTVESDIVPAGEGSAQEQSTAEPRAYTTAEKIAEFERLRAAKPKTDSGLVQERIRRRTRHPQDATNW